MDSVVLAFGRSTVAEAMAFARAFREQAADSRLAFYCDEYTEGEFSTEFEPDRRARVMRLLGSPPSGMVCVSARHGPAAEYALQFALACEHSLGAFVIDNDRGAIFSSRELVSRVHELRITSIFDI